MTNSFLPSDCFQVGLGAALKERERNGTDPAWKVASFGTEGHRKKRESTLSLGLGAREWAIFVRSRCFIHKPSAFEVGSVISKCDKTFEKERETFYSTLR
jgi:hypothetical protein